LRNLSHHLVNGWGHFKGLYPSVNLGAFDDVIRELDRWWRLRYPGFPDGVVLEIRTNITGTAPAAARKPAPSDPYNLYLEDMDRLFQATAPLAYSVSAIRLAIGGRRETGRGVETYELENRHKVW
jgi:hypothetical protein